MAFSFFGAFTDRVASLTHQFHQHWPDADLVEIESPFHGLAIRFPDSTYVVDGDHLDMPELASDLVQQISADNPGVRFVLLRVECWGGPCDFWGRFIRDGIVVEEVGEADPPAENRSQDLRRLIAHFDVDIGERQIFAPLRRDFAWTGPAKP